MVDWPQSGYKHYEQLGIITGNPGVFQGYPYPNPSKPVPLGWGTGLSVHGLRVLHEYYYYLIYYI
jgi:hypothetical protein